MTTPVSGSRTRLSPQERRAQLLDLGVQLLASRAVDEVSIDLLAEEAGISRGLLYHYFGNKHAFHVAVVRRAADDLIAQTAPPPGGEPLERLRASVAAYVDYVAANYEGYLSLVKGAAGGNETLRRIYHDARSTLSERMFAEDAGHVMLPDTDATRLMVRAWSAMAEELVLTWTLAPGDVTREQVLAMLTGSLPALMGTLPSSPRPPDQLTGQCET